LRRGTGKLRGGLILVVNKSKIKLIISVSIIFIVAITAIFTMSLIVNKEYKTTLEIYPSEESFEVLVDNKTFAVAGQKSISLKSGDVKIKVSKLGYDNYDEVLKVQNNDNNKFIIDMRKNDSSINNLNQIEGLKNDFIRSQNIVDLEYINNDGYWGVVTTQNSNNTNFAIFVAKRENNNWVLKYGPIFGPAALKNNTGLPQKVLDVVSGFGIEYFGERG
jgi:hypothetical protein